MLTSMCMHHPLHILLVSEYNHYPERDWKIQMHHVVLAVTAIEPTTLHIICEYVT
jgi:hypothetical protein